MIKRDLICEGCLCTEGVEATYDPYLFANYGYKVEVKLCEDCYQKREEAIQYGKSNC